MVTARFCLLAITSLVLLYSMILGSVEGAPPCSAGGCCDPITNEIMPAGVLCDPSQGQKRSIKQFNSSSLLDHSNKRVSDGLCISQESVCNGISSICPITLLPAGTLCAPALGNCDNPAYCTGASSDCPDQTFKPAGTVCGASEPCKDEDVCSGTSAVCLKGQPKSALSKCANSTGPCERDSFCNGQDSSCPAKVLLDQGTICNPADGPCQANGTCSGSSPLCRPKLFLPVSIVCSPATAICEEDSLCSGVSAICPPNPVKPSTTICSASSGPCQANAYCTGTSRLCPSKEFYPNGTICLRSDGPCKLNSTCDGQSLECNIGAFLPNGTPCQIAGSCDANPTCSGSSDYCQASGSLKPEGASCGLNNLCSRPLNNTCTVSGDCIVSQCSACPNGNYGADCSCPLPPKPSSGGSNATCINGVWSVPNLNTTSLVVYSNGSSTLIINGNLTLGANSSNSNTSTVLVFNGLATLNVTGCVSIYGKVQVILNTANQTRINATLIRGTPCQNALNFDDVEISAQDSEQSCKKISAESNSESRGGLGVLMNINSDGCKKNEGKNIIVKAAAGATGAVVGICIIGAAIWAINRNHMRFRSSSMIRSTKN